MAQTQNRVQKYVSVGGRLTDSQILDDGSIVQIGPAFSAFETETWNASTVRAGNALSAANLNESVANFQATVGSTGSDASYEKPALFAAIKTSDVSDVLAEPALRFDAVGGHFSGTIAEGNTQGRVWGATCAAVLEEGEDTDGTMTGLEVTLFNNAAEDQVDLGTPFNKTGISIVSYGSQNSTNAITILPGGSAQWHRGIVAYDSSFDSPSKDSFIQLVEGGSGDSLFRVTPAGDVTAGDIDAEAITAASVSPEAFFPRVVNQSSPPTMAKGEMAIWGDTSSGFTYLVFYNGMNQLKIRLQ